MSWKDKLNLTVVASLAIGLSGMIFSWPFGPSVVFKTFCVLFFTGVGLAPLLFLLDVIELFKKKPKC